MINEKLHTQSDTLSNYISEALTTGAPFCVCRFPGKTEWEVFAERDEPEIEGPYFVIQPWGESGSVKMYSVSENSFAGRLNISTQENGQSELPAHTTFDEYEKQFQAYKKTFENGSLKKAVLSRIKRIPKPVDFNAFDFFKKLEKAYPRALVYLLSHPATGMWMGASPEILVEKTETGWQTVSLAGTLPTSANVNWTKKEKIEQEYVSAHIREALIASGISKFKESIPDTVQAGNVNHLKSTFHFDGPATQGFFKTLVSHLHPTPAVAGLPAKEAADFINRTELHHRGLYTGYLGIVNLPERVSLYVNLRCMQIGKSDLALYLGGGITVASDLPSEWEETEQKATTILQYLND